VDIEQPANGRPICSGYGKMRPGYDKLAARRFDFVLLWNMAVFFLYAMRGGKCPTCGIVVERVPWAEGKDYLTKSFPGRLGQAAVVDGYGSGLQHELG
jgi:transposase